MKTIAVVNHKGGVGKTTVAVTLGHWLSRQGHRTVLVDLDGQGNIAHAMGLQPRPALAGFLIPELQAEFLFTSGRENLWLVPNSKHGQGLVDTTNPQALQDAVVSRLHEFEFVILDAPPSVGRLHVSPLLACDKYVIPVKLTRASMLGARSVTDSVTGLENEAEIRGKFIGFLPNFWDQRLRESEKWLQFLYNLNHKLTLPPIPTDAKIPQAMGEGKTIWEYAPRSRSVTGVSGPAGVNVGGFEKAFESMYKVVCNECE